MYTDAPFIWEWMNYSLANPIFFFCMAEKGLYIQIMCTEACDI